MAPIKKTRIPEEIADRVRRLIVDRTFRPGQALPSERVLARRFGVSRGSIRDALRRKLKTGQSAIGDDTAFHAVLARATRNRVAVRIMETLNDLLIESRKLTLKQKGRPQRSLSGHEAIVAAMRRRDPDAAARAM